MPSALHHLVESVTDTYTVVAEHPRPGDIRPSVWEVKGLGGERWFGKLHVGAKLHRREVTAYQKWTVAMGAGRAPELVAADTQTRTVLITAVPGRGLDSLRLPAEQERAAYEQAGELLARLHTAAADEPTPEATEEAWDEAVAQLLDRTATYAPEHDLALVRTLAEEAPPSLPQLSQHGDYTPKNWMWDETEQRLRVIDFERAELRPAAYRDLSRLRYRILRHRPDLDAAFHHGYGRPLTKEEQIACQAYGALDALDSLDWGIKHRDIGLVDEAHTMLENLRLETSKSVWGGWRT
ncbi:aminoglycoside phosphotransferase family protein [Streptomyces sp. RLB3-5]|uniref:phosphotransferase enzyme family protein n=1 Tax=unclassified Streptomyces TaxID=2593676 RepID=UPI001163EC3C|nr:MULTISPECIES: aminoglycoside phosphotransferase family protein [unclassified Streptomyces]QDO51657.1 aminoglycoside phosphotransferase family protein [Streptomyces sp. RLB3-5]QDO61898.1 aminoglycoside phosphotransferase family protein [Streptomyces sp. RLB1-8]